MGEQSAEDPSAIPSDDERRYLRLLWSHFQQHGTWPNLERLQRDVDRQPDRFDLWAVGSAISYRLARRGWATEQEPSVTVRGASEVDATSTELADFVRLGVRCLDLYAGHDAAPTLVRADLPSDEFAAKKAARMLQGESNFVQTRDDEVGPAWSRTLNFSGLRQFIGMTDLGSYLNLEDAQAPRRRAANESLTGASLGLFAMDSPLVSSPTDDLIRTLLPADVASGFLTSLRNASARFREAGSHEDRRSAIRDLVFLLEAIRADLDEALPSDKDNDAIFQVANRFYIRHSKNDQYASYDPLWLSWIFHVFEATAYTWLGLMVRRGEEQAETP